MKAPLIFCSTSHSINVQKIFKIVLSKVSLPFSDLSVPLCDGLWYSCDCSSSRLSTSNALFQKLRKSENHYSSTSIRDQLDDFRLSACFTYTLLPPALYRRLSSTFRFYFFFRLFPSLLVDIALLSKLSILPELCSRQSCMIHFRSILNALSSQISFVLSVFYPSFISHLPPLSRLFRRCLFRLLSYLSTIPSFFADYAHFLSILHDSVLVAT